MKRTSFLAEWRGAWREKFRQQELPRLIDRQKCYLEREEGIFRWWRGKPRRDRERERALRWRRQDRSRGQEKERSLQREKLSLEEELVRHLE
jgi:hypothetical protein